MPLSPGTWLGQYEIRSHLGSGGVGDVYRAHDSKLNRDVALKLLPGDLIFMGTLSGVRAVVPGDRIEGAIEPLGSLHIPIGPQEVRSHAAE